MKFALVSLTLACCYCSASAVPPSSPTADSRLLLKSKQEVQAAAPAALAKRQQCVYADMSKTGTKTIVCGDPAPATLASLLQPKRPATAVEADEQQQQQQQPDSDVARTISEKCFGDKKKKEQVAVFVQQPEYQHQEQHYVAQPQVQYVQPQVQYVQPQQPQIQYLQPQIQYVQPQVQLVQPQVHVVQEQPCNYVHAPPQVHYVQAPPQVHYVEQQHYVQAPQVHYVQQQHPIKSLCKDSYYGKSAEGYPGQVMVLDDDDDDSDDNDDSVNGNDYGLTSGVRSAVDPTVAVVWTGEPTAVRSEPLERAAGSRLSFGSIFRPAFRTASETAQFREYPGDIAADFQQQLSQQQQQVQELPVPSQQQLSYGGGGGFPGQMQQPSSYGNGYPYDTVQMSRSGSSLGQFRGLPRGGYVIRPETMMMSGDGGALSRSAPEFHGRQLMLRSNSGGDGQPPVAIKPLLPDRQNVKQPQSQQSTDVGQTAAATPKDATTLDNAKKILSPPSVVVGDRINVPKNPTYERQPSQ